MKEWEKEPDRVEFKHEGFDCLINRNPVGAWCGYVAIPEGHPWFEKGYEDLDDVEIDVHGGLTYAEHCQGQICHKTDSEDKVWWLGFDCAHAWDIVPKYYDETSFMYGHLNAYYRNQDFVTKETKSLAEQALEAARKK